MNLLSISKNAFKLSCLLTVTIFGAGCVANTQDPGQDEPLGQAEQAFSGYWGVTWQTTSPTQTDADLGSANDKACFLSGIGGDLDSHLGAPAPPGVTFTGWVNCVQ